MDFLASCSVEESQKFSGKLVVPAEDEGKPGKVMLNIVCRTGDKSLIKHIGGNVKSVTYIGDMMDFDGDQFESMPDGVFHEVCLSEYEEHGAVQYAGVTTLIRVPDGYCNMRHLYDICNERSDVRIIGGNLLGIDGVRIGRFQSGKDKIAPVFNGVYDSFLEVDLSELNDLTELVKKAKKKMKTSSDGESKKKKKGKSKESNSKPRVNKVANSFSCLFNENDEEEF